MIQNIYDSGKNGQSAKLVFFLAWTVTVASTIAGYAPLLLTIILALFLIAGAVWSYQSCRYSSQCLSLSDFSRRFNPRLALTLLLFFLYVLVSTLWSMDIKTTTNKAFLLAFVISAIYLGYPLVRSLNQRQSHQFARGILIGTIIALAFPLFELLTNMSILNHIADNFPGLIKTIDSDRHVPNYYLNKSITALALFFWPALLVAWQWQGAAPYRPVLAVLLVGMTIPAVFLSESETAKIALVVGSLAFLMSRYLPRLTDIAVKSFWTIAVFFAVPLVMALHWTGAQDNTALPYSARDRIHIWNYIAERVPQNPLLGIGIRSSRFQKKEAVIARTTSPTRKLQDHQGWHSHNMYLQTWYELGAVGAALLLAIGLLILQTIKGLKKNLKPFAYAVFASCTTTAAFGFGMWQSWLLAAYAWSIIFLLIALKYANENCTKK